MLSRPGKHTGGDVAELNLGHRGRDGEGELWLWGKGSYHGSTGKLFALQEPPGRKKINQSLSHTHGGADGSSAVPLHPARAWHGGWWLANCADCPTAVGTSLESSTCPLLFDLGLGSEDSDGVFTSPTGPSTTLHGVPSASIDNQLKCTSRRLLWSKIVGS